MPSIKAVALAATLAATAAAYSTPLEARNDLDFTPEDIDVLFGRDVEIDADDFELLARDLDIDAEDLEVLIARGGLLSGALSLGKDLFKGISKHKEGISNTFNGATQAISTGQQIRGQQLANKATAQQVQGGGYSGGRRKRSLHEDEDELQLIARDLDLDVEDVAYLFPRGPTTGGVSAPAVGRPSRGERVMNHGMNALGVVSTIQMMKAQHDANKQAKQAAEQGGMPSQRRSLFEEDPELWF